MSKTRSTLTHRCPMSQCDFSSLGHINRYFEHLEKCKFIDLFCIESVNGIECVFKQWCPYEGTFASKHDMLVHAYKHKGQRKDRSYIINHISDMNMIRTSLNVLDLEDSSTLSSEDVLNFNQLKLNILYNLIEEADPEAVEAHNACDDFLLHSDRFDDYSCDDDQQSDESGDIELQNEIANLPASNCNEKLFHSILNSNLGSNFVKRFCNLHYVKTNPRSKIGIIMKMARHLLLFRVTKAAYRNLKADNLLVEALPLSRETVLNAADRLFRDVSATTDYHGNKTIIKVLSTEARFSFYLHNDSSRAVLFKINSLFSIPFAILCINDEIEAKKQLDHRWEIANAIERLLSNNYESSSNFSLKDDLVLIETSDHLFNESHSGILFYDCIYNARHYWKENFKFALEVDIPILFLHQRLYWDGFPAYSKHWKSFVLFAATIAEFDQSLVSGVDSPAILPVAIIEKEVLKNDFTYKNFAEAVVEELIPYSNGRLHLCPISTETPNGLCLIIAFNITMLGDSPGRAEGLGLNQTGVCMFCGCLQKDYINSITSGVIFRFKDSKWSHDFFKKIAQVASEAASQLLPEKSQKIIDREFDILKIHHVSPYYNIPGSFIIYQLGLDYMHAEVIGIMEDILFKVMDACIIVERNIWEIFSELIQQLGKMNNQIDTPSKFKTKAEWEHGLSSSAKLKTYLVSALLLHSYINKSYLRENTVISNEGKVLQYGKAVANGNVILLDLQLHIEALTMLLKWNLTPLDVYLLGLKFKESRSSNLKLYGEEFLSKKLNGHMGFHHYPYSICLLGRPRNFCVFNFETYIGLAGRFVTNLSNNHAVASSMLKYLIRRSFMSCLLFQIELSKLNFISDKRSNIGPEHILSLISCQNYHKTVEEINGLRLFKPSFIVYNYLHIRIGNFIRSSIRLDYSIFHVEEIFVSSVSKFWIAEILIVCKQYSKLSSNSLFEEYSTENKRFLLNIFDVMDIVYAYPVFESSNILVNQRC